MAYRHSSRWSKGTIAAVTLTSLFGLAAVGGCTALVVSELSDWRDERAHQAACRADENRQNLPDDGTMREIPQRCWEVR